MRPATDSDGHHLRGKRGLIWAHDGKFYESDGRKIPRSPKDAVEVKKPKPQKKQTGGKK